MGSSSAFCDTPAVPRARKGRPDEDFTVLPMIEPDAGAGEALGASEVTPRHRIVNTLY